MSTEEGEQFAKEHGLIFLETSARTAHNVEEVGWVGWPTSTQWGHGIWSCVPSPSQHRAREVPGATAAGTSIKGSRGRDGGQGVPTAVVLLSGGVFVTSFVDTLNATAGVRDGLHTPLSYLVGVVAGTGLPAMARAWCANSSACWCTEAAHMPSPVGWLLNRCVPCRRPSSTRRGRSTARSRRACSTCPTRWAVGDTRGVSLRNRDSRPCGTWVEKAAVTCRLQLEGYDISYLKYAFPRNAPVEDLHCYRRFVDLSPDLLSSRSPLPRTPTPFQSYGIKVGYGAGNAAGTTVKPGEGPAAKSSSCC